MIMIDDDDILIIYLKHSVIYTYILTKIKIIIMVNTIGVVFSVWTLFMRIMRGRGSSHN